MVSWAACQWFSSISPPSTSWRASWPGSLITRCRKALNRKAPLQGHHLPRNQRAGSFLQGHLQGRGFRKLRAVPGRQVFVVELRKFLFRRFAVSAGAGNPRFCADYAISGVLMHAKLLKVNVLKPGIGEFLGSFGTVRRETAQKNLQIPRFRHEDTYSRRGRLREPCTVRHTPSVLRALASFLAARFLLPAGPSAPGIENAAARSGESNSLPAAA